MNLETTLHNHIRFSVGDHVTKTTGDYTYDGIIVGMFMKLDRGTHKSSLVRVNVEDDRGCVHIFTLSQLTNKSNTIQNGNTT